MALETHRELRKSQFFPFSNPVPTERRSPRCPRAVPGYGLHQPFTLHFLTGFGDFFWQLHCRPHAGGAASIGSIIPIVIRLLHHGFLFILAPLDLPFRPPASALGFIALSRGEEMGWPKAGGCGGCSVPVPTLSPIVPSPLRPGAARRVGAPLISAKGSNGSDCNYLSLNYFSKRCLRSCF